MKVNEEMSLHQNKRAVLEQNNRELKMQIQEQAQQLEKQSALINIQNSELTALQAQIKQTTTLLREKELRRQHVEAALYRQNRILQLLK